MRQLAAIMFSDMAGYTALMQQNEQLAKLRHRRLKEVLEASVSAHHGKILQYYGDGALLLQKDSAILFCIYHLAGT